ncbi:MAG: O-antigen ligase family protein [Acidimicrobiales bacterium]
MQRFHFVTQLLQKPDAADIALLAIIVLGALALAYLLSRVEVTVLAIIAILLEVFSGNWGLMSIPVPLDRVFFGITLCSLVLKGARNVSARRLVVRPVHIALLCATTWAVCSAIIAGTIEGSLGFYALVDRFGIVPFIWFLLAPVLFGTARQRRLLIGALVGLGLYLGLTGTLEGLHLYRFIFPHYIAEPNVGIQWGRARGPILESTGDGFCTFVGGTAAAVGLKLWKTTWVRGVCLAALALDLATLFFTLTRSVWIGALSGIIVAMLLSRRSRRVLIPGLVVGAVVVGVTLAASPTLRTDVVGRAESQSPVWDRQNTDLAALRILTDMPLSGVGWENFINVAPNYMVQQPGYPLSGFGIEVHNVFLSHAAELGIPGLLLWLMGFLGAVRRGLLPGRRGAPQAAAYGPSEKDLAWWRWGGFAIVPCFLVIANLSPFSQALPNTLLWMWLGVMAIPYTSRLRVPARQVSRARAVRPQAERPISAPVPTDLSPVPA